MKAGSLRFRLLSLASVSIVLSLIAAGLLLNYLFTSNMERSAREDMRASLSRLIALIDVDPETPALIAPMPDPRYDTPMGGRYWQIEALDNNTITRSRSLWDVLIDTPISEEAMFHALGPDGQHLLMLMRRVEIAGESPVRSYRVTVGMDHGPIHAAANSFMGDVTRLLALLGVLMIGLAWLMLRFGLAPLSVLRRSVDAVRQGRAVRVDGKFPSEVRPLVDEVNSLLDARTATTERVRAKTNDLAHGLKTPLAALHGIAELLRDKDMAREADLLQGLTQEMSERIDYQLRLATIGLRATDRSATSSLNTAALRTIAVLKKTGRGEELHWIADLSTDCQVAMHRQDLMELMGVTLENAAKWAKSKVIVRANQHDGKALLTIEDDGPGIPDDRLATIGQRGTRLDQSLPGTGLGLAIATEILDVHGGAIKFSRAAIGGLKVEISLPVAPTR